MSRMDGMDGTPLISREKAGKQRSRSCIPPRWQLATRHSSVDVLMKLCVDSAQGIGEVVSKIRD
jgi:hypothetical protein